MVTTQFPTEGDVGARRPHASRQKNSRNAGKDSGENEQSAPPDARASVAVVQDVAAMPAHVAMTAVQRTTRLRSHRAHDTAHDSSNRASHERSANGACCGAFGLHTRGA